MAENINTLLIVGIMLALPAALSARSFPVQSRQNGMAIIETLLQELLDNQIATDQKTDTIVMPEEPRAITCSTNATAQKAIRDYNKIWSDSTVYYEFENTLGNNGRKIVLDAIAEYERRTCLNFVRRSHGARVIFTADDSRGCYSDTIGVDGGVQYVYLPVRGGCQWYPTALHEIGHAIGFYHEQSRPDRDQYVTVHTRNIQNNQQYNFNINYGIDYQGEKYDYGSIMHYPRDLFSANGFFTLTVNNQAEYVNQGRPALGQARNLSDGDVRTVDKLYNCYNAQGRAGYLRIEVRRVTNLRFNDRYYAQVIPWSTRGEGNTLYTPWNNNGVTRNPQWYTLFQIGEGNWRFFEITIWNNNHYVVIGRQTIWTEEEDSEEQYCVGANECVYLRYTVR